MLDEGDAPGDVGPLAVDCCINTALRGRGESLTFKIDEAGELIMTLLEFCESHMRHSIGYQLYTAG
jgi:hypothetical protein